MKASLLTVLCLLFTTAAFGQKKILDHADFDIWNTIQTPRISNNGEYIIYSLERGEEDNFLKLRDTKGKLLFEHERAEAGRFTFDSQFALFTIKPWHEEVRALKRQKTKKEHMPKDTLAILN